MTTRRPDQLHAGVALLAVLLLLLSACTSSGAAEPGAPTEGEPTEPSIETEPTEPTEPSIETEPTIEAEREFTATKSDAEVETALATFVAEQTSGNAAAAVEAIADNRNERWVPWLLDLLRINVSSQVSATIGETLEAITGVESGNRIPNMIAIGGWAQTRELDGGEGYRAFKSTLYERIDPQFGPLLDSVESQLDVAAIQWGGVPLGGIPELNNPERVTADEATWMVDDEIILGVIANGQAVAYPLRILARHELANDTVGGDELAVVYCTLCRSALVYERDINGQTLNFLTSGLLSNSNKIMYDLETGSLWSHLRGVGIGGELTGTELVLRSVNHMRWNDWVAENPDTEVLSLPAPIFFDDPERPPISYDYTPGEAYQSYYDNPDVWFPILDTPDTFAIKTEVVGIRVNDDAVAFDVAEFNEVGETIELEVGGETLTIEPTGVGVRVFDSAGQRFFSEQSFWFAWYANNPTTRTLDFSE